MRFIAQYVEIGDLFWWCIMIMWHGYYKDFI